MKLAKQHGVTLIELMIVIVVVAILAGVAVPTYRNYLLRTNRTEATMALLRVQTAQEKFYLQNNRYADDDELEDAPPNGLGVPARTPNGYYTIVIDQYAEDGTTYRAVATAAAGQTKDVAACQTLSINQDGARSPSQDSGCWR
jgi:type IV pilus assembly protein PilE